MQCKIRSNTQQRCATAEGDTAPHEKSRGEAFMFGIGVIRV